MPDIYEDLLVKNNNKPENQPQPEKPKPTSLLSSILKKKNVPEQATPVVNNKTPKLPEPGIYADLVNKNNKGKTALPEPGIYADLIGTSKPYFSTSTPTGATLGYSQEEKDTSGRPYFAYRNPGDTATTTDYTRTATRFDPRTPQKLFRDDFYNPRAVENRQAIKEAMGGAYDDELDHRIALALSGSNNEKNLKPIPAGQNQAFGQIEQEYQKKVINGEISLFDAQVALARAKGFDVPWTPKEARAAKASVFGDFVKKVSDTWKFTVAPAIDKATTAPEYKKGDSVLLDTFKLIPSTLVETLAPGVKAIRENQQDAANVRATDIIKNIPKATAKTVGSMASEMYVAPFLTVYGAIRVAATNDPSKAAVSIHIPGIGDVNSKQMNAVTRINNGENPYLVSIEEGIYSVFDTLMLYGAMRAVTQPRQVVTAKTTGEMVPRKNTLSADTSKSKVFDQGPKSFRSYEKPVATQFLPKDAVDQMVQEGINFGPKFDATRPTFFRVSGKGKGNIVTGEIVQLKPSIVDSLMSKLSKSKSANRTYFETAINNSLASNINKAIESGDIPQNAVYKTKNILTPEFAQGRIDDIAQKLDMFQKGLGAQYRNMVDINNSTMQGLIDTGEEILKNNNIFGSLPTPEVVNATIAAKAIAMPKTSTEVVHSESIDIDTVVPVQTASAEIPGYSKPAEQKPLEPQEIINAAQKPALPEPGIYADLVNKPQEEVLPKQETPEIDSLFEEAKKHKSVDSFLKSQGNVVYRGGEPIDLNKITSLGISVSTQKPVAERFKSRKDKGVIEELYISPTAKVFDAEKATPTLLKNTPSEDVILDYAKRNGFDAIDFTKSLASKPGTGYMPESEIRILNPSILKKKNDLVNIWNKANNVFYRGSAKGSPDVQSKEFIIRDETNAPYNSPGFSITANNDVAKKYGDKIEAFTLNPNANIIDLQTAQNESGISDEESLIKWAKSNGFDGIDLRKSTSKMYANQDEIRLFNTDAIIKKETTPKQLKTLLKKNNIKNVGVGSVPEKQDNSKEIRTKKLGELKNVYKNTGLSDSGMTYADESLGQILIELELAERGRRIATPSNEPGINFVWSAKRSTFPEWIPENMRTRKDIDEMMDYVESIETLRFPEKSNSIAKARFINALLDQVDFRLGVDTSAIRNDIINTYAKPKEEALKDTEKEATKSVSQSNIGEINAEEIDFLAAKIQDADADLIKEAKKYSDFDSFLKSRGKPVYHGTQSPLFEVFDEKKIGSRDSGWFGKGFYFTGIKGEAKYYGPNVIEAYLDIKNPFDFSKYSDPEYKGYDYADGFYLSNLAEVVPEINDKLKVSIADEKPLESNDFKRLYRDITFGEYNRRVKEENLAAKSTKFTMKDGPYPVQYYSYTDIYGLERDLRIASEKTIRDEILNYALFNEKYKVDTNTGFLYGVEKTIADVIGDRFTERLKELGYDGTMQSPEGDEYVAFYPYQIKTKAQLEKIWKQANEDKSLRFKSAMQKREQQLNDLDLVSLEEGKAIFNRFFSDDEIKYLTTENIEKTKDGNVLFGKFYTRGVPFEVPKMFMEITQVQPGKVSGFTIRHEAVHAYLKMAYTQEQRDQIFRRVKRLSVFYKQGSYSSELYKTADKRAEEFLADDFNEYIKYIESKGKVRYKGFFASLWERAINYFKDLLRRYTGAKKLYDDLLNRRKEKFTQEIAKTDTRTALQRSKQGGFMNLDEIIKGFNTPEAKMNAERAKFERESKQRADREATGDLPVVESLLDSFKATIDPIKTVDLRTRSIFRNWNVELLKAREIARTVADEAKDLPRGMDEIHAYENGTSKNGEAIKEFFDTTREQFNQRGLEIDYVERYIPHLYEENNAQFTKIALRYLEGKGLGTKEAMDYLAEKKRLPREQARILKLTPMFEKERLFSTYREAMDAGLTPKFTNVGDLMSYYVFEGEKALANKSLMEKLESSGKIMGEEQAPMSWSKLNPQFTMQYNMRAPGPLARILNNLFVDTNIGSFPRKFFATTAKVASKAQEITLSAGVPFTNINFFSTGQLIKELTAGNTGAFFAYFRANSTPNTIRYFKENEQYIAMMTNYGIDLTQRIGFNDRTFKDLVQKKAWKDAIGVGFDKLFNEKTFKSFMPMMQVDLFKKVYLKALEKGMDEATAQRLAAQTIKNNFGLFTDQFLRSELTNNVLSTIFFAPKFREGIIRTLARTAYAGYDFTRNKFNFKKNNPAYARNLRLLGGMIMSFLVYQLVNKALNDTYTWENPEGREFAIRVPTDGNMVLYVEFMPGFLAFPRMIGTGSIALASGDFKRAIQKFGGLLSTPMKLITDILGNEDYFGREIYKEGDSGIEASGKILKYLGLNTAPPYIKELINYATSDDVPLLQTVITMLEIPLKFSTLDKEARSALYKRTAEIRKEISDKQDKFMDTYKEIKDLYDSGNTVEANKRMRALSDSDWEIYKSIERSEKAANAKKNQGMGMRIYEQVNDLKIKGNVFEANQIIQSLTDEEYKAYDNVRKKLEK